MDTNIINELNNEVKLGVIGCGKMASAILSGVINKKFLSPENVFVFDVNKDTLNNISNKFSFNPVSSIEEILKKSNVILLSTKPFVVDEVLVEINKNYNKHLILSILAGVKIEKFINILPNSKVIRIMPNTPALVNEGMSAICKADNVTIEEFDFAMQLMSTCGKVIQTTEDKIDIITALSGSGPAFYFKIIQLLAQSAQKLGLNKEEALLLSTQTALGSAKMIFENNYDIEQLIKNVTTPGGCTEVGNNVLNNSNIAGVFDKLIKDTMQKAIELG